MSKNSTESQNVDNKICPKCFCGDKNKIRVNPSTAGQRPANGYFLVKYVSEEIILEQVARIS